ncbi:hypothetical protein TNCV_3464841 [Trichonephila clavipes]|nr:hypothetical protein TNCV_3464841 [Trichonephila clavipes]
MVNIFADLSSFRTLGTENLSTPWEWRIETYNKKILLSPAYPGPWPWVPNGYTHTGQHAYPYHVTLQQLVLTRDSESRFDLCIWALITAEGNSNLESKIIWTDEELFQHTGLLNQHDVRWISSCRVT